MLILGDVEVTDVLFYFLFRAPGAGHSQACLRKAPGRRKGHPQLLAGRFDAPQLVQLPCST